MRVAARSHAARDGRSYQIGSACPGEAGAVLDHAEAIHGRVAAGVDDLGRILGWLARAPDDLFLVARSGHAVVGTVSLKGGTIGLSVRAGWRRQGVARRLMETAIAATRPQPLALEVEERNVPACRLYRSLGFREDGRIRGRVRMALGATTSACPSASSATTARS